MKNSLVSNLSSGIFVLLLFLIVGCAEPNGGDSNSTESGNTSTNLGLTVTSIKKQKLANSSGQSFSAMAVNGVNGTLMQGEMLVENIDTSTQEIHDWSIYLNEDTFEVESNKTLVLEEGNYQFSLLVAHGDQQYAGMSSQTIMDGENTIALTLRPVIGDTVIGVSLVSELADFKFQYDASEISAAGITNPNIGITVNGGLEEILAINPATGISDDYLNLPQGEHTIELKLYDGGLQKGKSISSQQTVQVIPGYDIAMDLVALHGEAVFILTEDGGDATFQFIIPSEVVDEAGGTGNLTTLFSVVGPKNPLRESTLSLTEDASGDYRASITHSGFQFDDVTLSLTFSEGSELLGSCNQAITIDATTQNLLCDLTLRRRAIASGNLLATLAVNVFDEIGEPVPGATIYNGSTILGITGSQAFGTEGYLKVYLNAGNYTLEAEAVGESGTGSIDLIPLTVNNLEISLTEPLPDPTAFITVWKTDNTGTVISSHNQIKLPLYPLGTFDFTVDWGDGSQENITSYNQAETTHTYASAGTYTVTIQGQIEGFGFSQTGKDNSKLIDVLQWGNVKLHNATKQFYSCDNLIGFSATDTLDVSNVTNMTKMFQAAEVFNADLSSWDVSNVTDMTEMFFQAKVFNGDLSTWDVSNVTDMSAMFRSAEAFSGDLSSWNVSNVTDMSSMFTEAFAFSSNLSSWDVSNVIEMGAMFNRATVFESDLSSWNVSNVRYMRAMFSGAEAFNSDLSSWDVSGVTSMNNMFGNAKAFNGNLSSWNVSNVTDMAQMFQNATVFNGDLSSWDVSNVTDMAQMFYFTANFSGDLSSWNVSNVTDMRAMFGGASAFNSDLSSWNVSNVTDMRIMFNDASTFNQDLSGWCVTNIPSTPDNFAGGSLLDAAFYPVWGTCSP